MTTLKPGSGYPDTLATVYIEGCTHIEAFITQDGKTEGGLTIAAVKANKPKEKVLVLPLGEAMKLIEQAQDAEFILPWEEITEERYEEMLNVLPPEKWQTVNGVSIFRMSEYYTSNITSHFAKFSDRYFAGRFRTNEPSYEEHAAAIAKITA